MSVARIGLFDLLAPQYVAGIQFPDYIQRYLAVLGVDELHTTYDNENILYTGIASFEGNGSGNEVLHEEPGGATFTWNRRNIQFRLLIPRNGAEFIDRAANHLPATDKLPQVSSFLNALKPAPDADMDIAPVPVTDYPGSTYRLELLLDALNFTLGDEWKPGRIASADNRARIDSDHATERIQIKLPKVLLSYSQGDNADDLNPQFAIEGWGIAGFDAPADVEMGELVRMSHPIAIHESEHVAFSVDKLIVDFSEDATPPELLEHFGVDEGWKGVYAKQLLFYYSNEQGVGFNLRINEALIGFDGVVSFEAALDVYPILSLGGFTVIPKFYNGQSPIGVQSDGFIFDDTIATAPSGNPQGNVTVRQGAVMQLEIRGGTPPYHVETSEGGANHWDNATRQLTFPDTGDHNIFIHVVDAQTGLSQRRHTSYYKVHVNAAPSVTDPPSGTAADRPAATDPLQALPGPVITGNDTAHVLAIKENGSQVQLRVTTGSAPYNIIVTNGTTEIARSEGRDLQVEVPNGSNYNVTVDFPAVPAGGSFPSRILQFPFGHPTPEEVDSYSSPGTSVPGFNSSRDTFLRNLPNAGQVTSLNIATHASNENEGNANYDQLLSERRLTVATALLSATYSGIPVTTGATGHSTPLPDATNPRSGTNRVAIVTFTSTPGVPQHSITATLSRPAAPPPPQPQGHQPPAVVGTPPPAPPFPNNMPPVVKQLGIRVKVERNKLSLLELYGKIDFETELEKNIRTGITDAAAAPENGGTLNLQHGNAHDGELDFKLTYEYDKATSETTLNFLLHSDERDTDGLLHMDNNANRDDRFKNIFGALLLFAPIINQAATSAGNNSHDAGAWVELGLSIGVPVAIGGLNVFRTRKIILYGGEARSKFVVPKAGEPLRSLDIGLVFDYEVQFDIIIEALGIGRNRLPGATLPLPPPLKARYKAIGFNIHYADLPASGTTPAYKGVSYRPVFDSSKGYDLDLSDPSLFSLPDPLGALFNIVGARLARFNPVTLEVDFAIKVDLGVITVDRFKLKIPLDPVGPPQIIPSGVRVNIPGVLVGNGFVEVIDADIPDENGNTIHAKGVEGALDLTLVALKVRVSANIGLGTLHDSTTGRDAVSVFVGLRVEFPTPIILFQTGLGIYGFMGLFAMHYKRLESSPDPTSAVGPALGWLVKAEGDPTKLKNSAGDRMWQMAMDKWSFGIGVILGTIDGGILMNFQGMLVLELPGPRILIMVKMKLVSLLPSQPANPASVLTTGIIGIIDLDFNRKTLTLGVLVSFEIKSILSVALPIELFFDLQSPSNWHLYVGTISNPASAMVLGIVRGSAYLMIQGNDLTYPSISRVPQIMQGKTLRGIAVAAGLECSLVLGDESIGIYLKLSAGAHLGVSFSPFLVIGTMYFSGRLRLVVASIGASGHFDIIVSQIPGSHPVDYKVYMKGEVCGSIDLFFFDISACVGITIGDKVFDFDAPPLVRGMYLQSFSQALTGGQGSSRPIDASLGNAIPLGNSTAIADPSKLPVVPIDTVPVLQFNTSPLLDAGFAAASFVASPGNISGTNGVQSLGEGNSIEYKLQSITLTEQNGTAYASPDGIPPSVWRVDRPNGASLSDTSIDLATFSRVPTATEHALERSTDLQKNITIRWENACKRPAPPAPVLFTFCGQPIGTSAGGWLLNGIAKPDPDGTIRATPVNTIMKVYQPRQDAATSTAGMVLNELGVDYTVPARIVGLILPDMPLPSQAQRKCFKLTREKVSYQPNPLIIEKDLRIYSAAEKRSVYSKAKGFTEFGEFRPFESPYRTHFRSIRKTIGLSIREYMRIDVIGDPVQAIILNFTSFKLKARLIAYAYDEHGALVDQQTFIHKEEDRNNPLFDLTLSAASIKYVLIYNRDFTGQFVEICYERGGRNDKNNLAKYARCFRSLQLPYQGRWKKDDKDRQQLLDGLKEYIAKRKYYSEVIFETGPCEAITFYGAVSIKSAALIIIEELDAMNNVLHSATLDSLPPKFITNPLTDLPADWLDAALPWRENVVPVVLYLHSHYFNGYERITFEVKPRSEQCTRIRISTFSAQEHRPVMFISAVETLQLSEIVQHDTMTGVLETEQNTIDGYLGNNIMVPLLKPGTVYIMHVNYEVKKIRENAVIGTTTGVQNFAFKTDTAPPKELKSYVLGATPEMDERFHFYEDAIKVVFNDASFLQMLAAYGKTLKGVIRGADGIPVGNSPDLVHSLEPVAASVLSAYRDTILSLIAGGLLPCHGEINLPDHAAYTTPFQLKPLMSYTFDIEFNEPDAIAAGQAAIPFYRRAFTTSRFADLNDFVQEIQTGKIYNKALKTAITGMPAASAPASVHIITDVEFENAVTGAGIAQKDDLSHTACTLLWNNSAGDFVPYGLLIESAEPVWRMRTEPGPVPVKNQQDEITDPAFVVIQNKLTEAMILRQKAGQNVVSHFVRSSGGTRTLVFFRAMTWPATGRQLTIELVQTPSTLYDLAEKAAIIYDLKLTGKAPWEE